MANVKMQVKKTFRDKVTRRVYAVGEIIEITKERLDEIEKKLPGSLAEPEKKPAKKEA